MDVESAYNTLVIGVGEPLRNYLFAIAYFRPCNGVDKEPAAFVSQKFQPRRRFYAIPSASREMGASNTRMVITSIERPSTDTCNTVRLKDTIPRTTT